MSEKRSFRWHWVLVVWGVLGGYAGMVDAAPASRPASVESVEVDVVGEGLDRDHALRVALRRAMERAGKAEIFSETQVENYQLLHDTIICRSKGIISDYKVLGERPVPGGTYEVRIRAKVSKRVLAENWAELQNVLNQVGRPRIVVLIDERIDGQREDKSILATRIEERLLRSGFDLVTPVERIATAPSSRSDGEDVDAVARLQKHAKDLGAQIFLTGSAHADSAGLEQPFGVPAAFYNCDVQLRMYYTDTGKVLASAGIPSTRRGERGQREHNPQAAKRALAAAGEQVVEEIYQQVMEQWATAISAGREITLVVHAVSFEGANSIRSRIAELKGVEKVHMELVDGVATYRINTLLSAIDMAQHLTRSEEVPAIEVVELKLNRIRARLREE